MTSKTETNDITELRALLFDSIRSLKKGASADDITRAKTQSDIAQIIINSVKVEIDMLRVAGGKGSGFIKDAQAMPAVPAIPEKKVPGISHPASGVTRHLMT